MQKNKLKLFGTILFSVSLLIILINLIGQDSAARMPEDTVVVYAQNLQAISSNDDNARFIYDSFDDGILDSTLWNPVDYVTETGGKAILSTSGLAAESHMKAAQDNLVGMWVSAVGYQDIVLDEHVNIHLATETPAKQIVLVGIARNIYSENPFAQYNQVICQWFGSGVPGGSVALDLGEAQWGTTYEFGLEYTASGTVLVWVNGAIACAFPAAEADVAYAQGSAPFWFMADSVDSGAGGAVTAELDWAHAKMKSPPANNDRWQVQTINSDGIKVAGLDLALDSYNQPHIGYTTVNRELFYTHLKNYSWVSQTIANSAVSALAIVLDDANTPHVTYTQPGPDIIYARLNGNSWITDTVDGDAVVAPSLALDSSGNPHLAYQDVRPTHLPWARGIAYAYWTGSQWQTSIIDKSITGCEFDCDTVSLVLDSFDSPQVAYRNIEDNRIIHAKYDSNTWMTKTVDISSFAPQLVLNSTDVPHVVYTHEGPVAKFGAYDGALWQTHIIDDWTTAWPSLTFDKLDQPHVAYCDVRSVPPGRGLKYAYLNGSNWVVSQVDRVECDKVSIELDKWGYPHIAYYDITNNALKYASWQPKTTYTNIPIAGGSLNSVVDQTLYTFPTNLFSDTVVISHTNTFPGSMPAHNNLVGINHDFDVSAVFSGTTDLAQPLSGQRYTMIVSYSDVEVIDVDESTLALYYWHNNQWRKEASSVVHESSNQVRATPNHFSLWRVLGERQWSIYLPVLVKR